MLCTLFTVENLSLTAFSKVFTYTATTLMKPHNVELEKRDIQQYVGHLFQFELNDLLISANPLCGAHCLHDLLSSRTIVGENSTRKPQLFEVLNAFYI